ncbi:hypothetical protein Tco_0950052 [Tanacetum coccineum]
MKIQDQALETPPEYPLRRLDSSRTTDRLNHEKVSGTPSQGLGSFIVGGALGGSMKSIIVQRRLSREIIKLRELVYLQTYSFLVAVAAVTGEMIDKAERELEKLQRICPCVVTSITSLKVFKNEFNWMSGMDDDLFTYEVEVANIPCDSNKDDDLEQRVSHEADDDMGYDPSDIRGDDKVELTDKEFSDNEDELAKTHLLRTLKDSRLMKKIKMIRSMNGTKMYHGLMRNHRLTLEFGLNPHQLSIIVSPYKTGYSEWPTCSWKNDGYCNGRNLPGAYIVGNSLHYQDYEWYEALKDSELKEQALRNKAIMEGLISDDESSNDGWRR